MTPHLYEKPGSEPKALSISPINFLIAASWFLGLLLASGIDTWVLNHINVTLSARAMQVLGVFPACLLTLGALLLGFRSRHMQAAMLMWAPYIAFVLFSVLWAEDKESVVMKSISTIIVIGSYAFVVASTRPEYLVRMLAYCGLIFGWTSLCLWFIAPDLATGRSGYFSGVFPGKGLLVDATAIAFLAAAALYSQKGRFFWLFVCVGCVVCVLFGNTVSAIFGLICALVVLRNRRLFLPIAQILIAVGIILPFLTDRTILEPLVQLIGKDLTFSGRIYLWQYTIDQFWQRPILGHGYLDIGETRQWTESLLPYMTIPELGVIGSHCHNLWLETLYMGGIVGLVALVIFMLLVPLRAGLEVRPIGLFVLPLLTYAFATGMVKVPFYGSDLIGGIVIFSLLLARVPGTAEGVAIRKNRERAAAVS